MMSHGIEAFFMHARFDEVPQFIMGYCTLLKGEPQMGDLLVVGELLFNEQIGDEFNPSLLTATLAAIAPSRASARRRTGAIRRGG